MEIFFNDPEDLPVPPEEVRIRELTAKANPDGRRVRVYLEITPFQRAPDAEVNIINSEKLLSITGVNVNLEEITKTIEFLNGKSDLDFEIRTTYVETLLTPQDVDDIVSFLEKLKFRGDFVLQQYQFREGVGEEFKRAFSKPEHEVLVKLLTPYKNRSLPFEIFLRDEIVGYCNLNELES